MELIRREARREEEEAGEEEDAAEGAEGRVRESGGMMSDDVACLAGERAEEEDTDTVRWLSTRGWDTVICPLGAWSPSPDSPSNTRRLGGIAGDVE